MTTTTSTPADHATKPSERYPVSVTFRCGACNNSSTQTVTLTAVEALQNQLARYAEHHCAGHIAASTTIEPTRLLFERINQAWRKHPQLRLGQLICNALLPSSGAETAPLFYADDGAFVAAIEAYKWPAKVAAPPSGEVAAPSPVERELGPEDFADSDCEACEGSGRIDTSGGRNDMYCGWRWCDCAIENRDARCPEQAPQAEATPPEPQCGAEYSHCTGGTQRCVEVDDEEPLPRMRIGERFSPTEPLRANSIGGYGPSFDVVANGGVTMVTAVRRVPLTEPEPVPESGDEAMSVLRHFAARGMIDVSADLGPDAMAQMDRVIESMGPDLARLMPEHLPAHWEALTKERDELRSKVSEIERELSQVARDEDGSLVRQGAWNAACCFEESANKRMATDKTKLAELDATLTATEAKLETWKTDAQYFKAERDKSDKMVDDANAELARVRGELAAERERFQREVLDLQRDNRVAQERLTRIRYHAGEASPHPTETPAVAAPAHQHQYDPHGICVSCGFNGRGLVPGPVKEQA